MVRKIKKIEELFEFAIWNFRFVILLPVVFGLLSTVNDPRFPFG
jgi:hypothetical protein